ncbi:MAG: hypothetical protein V3T48_09560, partial [Vicinamibacterales bacterium]
MLPQHRLVELAGRRMRQLVDEQHVVGHPPRGDLVFEEQEHGVLVQAAAFAADDEQQRPLVPLRMGDTDDAGLGEALVHGSSASLREREVRLQDVRRRLRCRSAGAGQ